MQGLRIFATLLGALGLVAAICTACWLLLFHFALKKLPPVQEALGLKKRDKPTLEEMRHEIEALKAQLRAAQAGHQRGTGGSSQPALSTGQHGLRSRR
ncbi:hypothetical protein COHA_007548 [Chlorella ohadii]|uniref:Uncharacterized protein n=1 Tax=Chlorella ohadii TaxID=2649997 RepID=A0AAD5DN46_9CHLO|nr:hypothetical protein COHA_007548 [Chlorella ohadii]